MQIVTDEPETSGGSPTDTTLADAADLALSDFAIPGKKLLPINTKSATKKAWSAIAKAEGLTSQERRQAYRRVLARLKKFGIDVTKYKVPAANAKPMADAAEQPVNVEWPEVLSLDDLRQCLRAELKEADPKFWLMDVYPGLGIVTATKDSYWDPVKDQYVYDNRTYSISYEITSDDDGDGDVDLCNIKFGEPKITLMTPKVIEDEEIVCHPGQAEILTDEAELAAGKPLRFRLPGPCANVVNKNNRIYPRDILADAIAAAQPRIQRGELVSYLGHPPRVKRADGSFGFSPDMGRRAAKIVAWFMDSHGQTFVDREIILTDAGKTVQANIIAKAAVATSMRGYGETVQNVIAGRTVQVARSLVLDGDDFVENPALTTTWAQAQILTDEAVSMLINTAPVPAALSGNTLPSETAPAGQQAATEATSEAATATPLADAATTNIPNLPDEQSQVTTPETEANMKFRRNSQGELILDNENGTLNAAGQPLADAEAPAPPAPSAQAGAASQSSGVILDEDANKDFNAWREERRADKAKKTVKSFLDDVFEGKETTSPKDPNKKVEKIDLSRFTDAEDIADIRAICDEASPDEVESVLQRAIAMKDKEVARRTLQTRGYGRTSATGQTTQGAIITDEAIPGREHVEKILAAMDNYGQSTSGNFRINDARRKSNQPFIDSLLGQTLRRHEQGRALADSAGHFLDAETTLESLLQQPTITPASAALITQIFWSLDWLSMCGGIGPEGFNQGPGSDSGIGENLRIPVETRGSGRRDLRVRENQPIPTVGTLLRWLNFAPEWRKLAFSLTPEAQVQLQRGSARYEALGRQMFAISQIFGESIDLELADEHYWASDEFEAFPVEAEAHVDGDLITLATTIRTLGHVPVADGGNIATVIKIAETIPGHNTVMRPIVRERRTVVIQEDGSQTEGTNTLLNPIVAQIGVAAPLVRGEIDAETGMIIDRPGVPGASYAVDYENGLFLFKAAGDSGVQAGAVPDLSYSYVTNMDVFDLGGSATADDLAIFYDSLLRRIDVTAGNMGSHPRYRPPTMAVFTLNNAVYAESARQAASLFKPEGTTVSVTAANPNRFGNRGGVNFMKVNTPLRSGHTRILLGQERSVKYGIQYPWKVEGPVHRYAMVAGVPTPTGTNFYYGQHNAVICTPVCFDKPNGVIKQLNHPFRTIKLVGSATL